MVRMELQRIYRERIDRASKETQQYERSLRWLSWARLSIFVALFYFGFKSLQIGLNSSIWIVVFILSLITFLWLITKYQRVQAKYTHLQGIISINKNELAVMDGKQSILPDGSEFAISSGFTLDLDILGEHSLFHYLNRCGTWEGRNYLFNILVSDPMDSERILSTQAAVIELAKGIDFRQDFLAMTLVKPEEKNWDSISKWLAEVRAYQINKVWLALIWVWPSVSFILLIYLILSGVYQPIVYWLIGGLLISGSQVKKTNKIHNQVSGYHSQLKLYGRLLKKLSTGDWHNQNLTEIQQIGLDGVQSLNILAEITKSFDHRLNGIAYILLNGLGLHDIRCLMRLEKWKEINHNSLKIWLESIGKFEWLSSLSSLHYNHPEFCFPIPKSGQPSLSFQELGHPLIQAKDRICNSGHFGPDHNFVIITGSNMAGKSTFLRTLGINVVLGQIGAPVCAKEMTFTPMIIFTSIRLSDSLQDNTSFFYAELKKLKSIISELEKGTHALVLLDEILKGTNSDDKQFGTERLIHKMISYPALTFLATHITSLGKLQTTYPDRIENWCFESEIKDGELNFNYKLQPGIAKNKNATFLMRKLGLIEENNPPNEKI